MFHTRTLNPKSLLLKIVLSLLSASCHNKFPLQGYNVSGSSTPFSEISQSLGYLWMPTYSLELEEKNTFFTYVLFLQFWRDWIFVRFWELILVVCILLWLFLIPFLEKTYDFYVSLLISMFHTKNTEGEKQKHCGSDSNPLWERFKNTVGA